jgi:hypothetical protein
MTKDPELSGLLTQVSKAFSGTGVLSKDALYSAAKRIAKRLAAEGESAEKAFVRLFTGRNSPRLESSSSVAKKALPAPNSSGDGDGLSLDDMVTAHMAKLPNISKGAATAAVINTPKGAAVYARERNARLTKALRG